MREHIIAYQLTFDQYDSLVEKFEKLEVPTYYPTQEQIELMEKDPEKWMLYACFLSECGRKPKSKEEEYRRKGLLLFINTYLELVENESEIIKPLSSDFRERN